MRDFPFTSATVSTISHATEDQEKVAAAMKRLLPGDAKIDVTSTKGHHGNPIQLLKAKITRKSTLEIWWKNFVGKLGANNTEKIRTAIPEKVDDSCRLYLRLDKQRACLGELIPTEGGDVIHITLKVAARPAKREVAVNLVEQLLSREAKL